MNAFSRDKAILEEVWGVLHKHDLSYGSVIRMAVRLIQICVKESGGGVDSFDYAKLLLARTAAQAEAVDGLKGGAA